MSLDLAAIIRTIPDYPVPGILFRDITTLLADGPAFRETVQRLAALCADQRVTRVAGIESRGFVFAAPVAAALGVGFVPLRKPGKLPATVVSQEYALEYGEDRLEMHADAVHRDERVLLIDDLIATGGTAQAGVALLRRVGAAVAACAFVVELPALGGRARLEAEGVSVHSLVTFPGH